MGRPHACTQLDALRVSLSGTVVNVRDLFLWPPAPSFLSQGSRFSASRLTEGTPNFESKGEGSVGSTGLTVRWRVAAQDMLFSSALLFSTLKHPLSPPRLKKGSCTQGGDPWASTKRESGPAGAERAAAPFGSATRPHSHL